MTLRFNPPTALPAGAPPHIAARCEVLNGDAVVGYFEKHDFRNGTWPLAPRALRSSVECAGAPQVSGIALDLEDLPPSQCYAFRDLNGMTQLASRDRGHLLQRIAEWLGVSG